MKDQVRTWYVRVKFKHKVVWDYRVLVPMTGKLFPSQQAAEDYAQNLFGVEKWEVRELTLSAEDARVMELVEQFFADYRAEDKVEADSSKSIMS
jgi:hypothetical protein